jgi:hypothetical protein
MRTDPITPILTAVKTLLRGRKAVSLPEQGIDLLFDEGVIARCRACRLSWEVKRAQFSSPGWWSCPSGCRHQSAANTEEAQQRCSA